MLAALFWTFGSVNEPPLATPVIWLPPLFKPAPLKLTLLPRKVTPPLLTTVLPVVTLVRPVNFSANWMFKVLLMLSATTPMLLSDSAVVAPPLTVSCSPRLRVTVVAVLSPVKSRPRSMTLEIPPFNCATFTASLSLVPAARLTIWRRTAASFPEATLPTLTAPVVLFVANIAVPLTPVGT